VGKIFSSYLAFAAIFLCYIFSLYVWYVSKFDRPFLISWGPYFLQALAYAITIFFSNSKIVPLLLVLLGVCFAALTTLIHFVAGYWGLASDFVGMGNIPFIFYIQFMISMLIITGVWILIKSGTYLIRQSRGIGK